jgi:hypothetical protein
MEKENDYLLTFLFKYLSLPCVLMRVRRENESIQDKLCAESATLSAAASIANRFYGYFLFTVGYIV